MEDLIINLDDIHDSEMVWKELGKLCEAVAQFSKNFDKICFLLPDYCFDNKHKNGDVFNDGLVHSKRELRKIFMNTMKSNFIEELDKKKRGYINKCEREKNKYLSEEDLKNLVDSSSDDEVMEG